MGKKFKAFTLVEMLIVMGILIILMAVGIASARFAMRRASRISHQNAAERIYQALQSYYSDNRKYPQPADLGLANVTPSDLLSGDGVLTQYIDEFDGGADASYVYRIDSTGQVVLICVSLGGHDDDGEIGFYCTGNGIGDSSSIPGAPNEKYVPHSPTYGYEAIFLDVNTSDWNAADGGSWN